MSIYLPAGVRRMLAAAGAAILPRRCLLCDAEAGERALCAPCAAELPRLPSQGLCPACALPLDGAGACGRCLREPPHYDATLAAFAYAYPVDRLIQALKYAQRLAVAPLLGALLADAPAPAAEVLIPLPLHPRRLRERGYNQAMELARSLARRWHLPVDARVCERIHDAPPQAALAWKERRRNVRGAFLCRTRLDGRHVAVVDDVMTTGATLDEFARALKKAGAARVTNCVVARTLPE